MYIANHDVEDAPIIARWCNSVVAALNMSRVVDDEDMLEYKLLVCRVIALAKHISTSVDCSTCEFKSWHQLVSPCSICSDYSKWHAPYTRIDRGGGHSE